MCPHRPSPTTTPFLDIHPVTGMTEGLRSVITNQPRSGHMVVKSVRGRRRDIVYTVPEDTRWDEVLEAVSAEPPLPQIKVISCFSGMAVIRTEPSGLEELGSRMHAKWPDSESLVTSGTLRTVRDRYPQLRVHRKRKG